MDDDTLTPGWYGKLPSLGDFAQRRLAPAFVEAWDAWLAEGLHAWQTEQPEAWLATYLAGASWRFVLLPGCLPDDDGAAQPAMAGVLMPSVDRVGRYFPFTAAWPLVAPPADAAALQGLLARLHQLDDLALDALQEDWSIDALEAALAALPPDGPAAGSDTPPPIFPLLPAADGEAVAWQAEPDLARQLTRSAWARWLEAHAGCAFWWSDAGLGQPRLHVSRGLPTGAAFRALFKPVPPAAADTPHPINPEGA